MIWLVLVALVLVVCFGAVILVGAPYLPTLRPQVQAVLDLADLQPGQTLLELGCGDGRVVLAATSRGLNVVAYELNPLLALLVWLRTRRYRHQVQIIWGDFWRADWPPAEAIFTFLLPKYMPKLDKKVMQYKHKPVKLVSFAFEIPDKPATQYHKSVFRYDYK